MALQRPLTGVGFGQFEPLSYELLPVHNDVHNLYLALAADSGVASALVALAFTAWCLLFGVEAVRALSAGQRFRFERGDLFLALHAGLPFWVALACLRNWRGSSTLAARDLSAAHGEQASPATVTSSRP